EAAAVPARAVAEAVPAAGAAVVMVWWARATVALPAPTISAAAVQFDIRRTCRMPSRRLGPGWPAGSAR
ncbi:MAG TPA: hypothetical protein DEH11_00910, partial [Actinobacteria bacterium]|nr:hypothetical protein [Actinomycetota bacterium]